MKEKATGIVFLSLLLLTALLASLSVSALPSIDNCNSTAGIVINASSEMNNSIKGNGTCITIGADNVTFDCSGFTLTFGINLTQAGGAAFGINISNRNNVTIRSCTIQLGDQNRNISGAIGINVTNSTNVTILNSTIIVNASANNNRGIMLDRATRPFLEALNVRVSNGSSNYGVYITASSTDVVLNVLNITANGTANNDGIRIDSVAGLNINNTNITTNGTLSYGINILTDAAMSFNNTLITQRPGTTGEWINFSNPDTVFTISNTTFTTPNGRINFRGSISVSAPFRVDRTFLNVSSNLARVNSSNLTLFNTTAHITLAGITSATPAPFVDFQDDGAPIACPGTICTTLSYANQEFLFRVTQFTGYSTDLGNANLTITKTDSVDPVTNGSLLTYTINISNNGTSNATNINLTDIFPSQVIFNATTGTQAEGRNDTYLIGNLTPGTSAQFTITVRVVTSAQNLTIMYNTVNISYTNDTGTLATLNVTESTNITPSTSGSGGSVTGGGGGGGGGGGSGTTRSMTTDTAQYVMRRTDRVNLNVNNLLHTITVINIFTDKVLIRAASTPQEFTLGVGKSQLVDFEKDGTMDVRVTLLAITYSQATLKIEKLVSTCAESWTCDAWSACENSQQTRGCVDLNNCGSTKSKPAETQSCTSAAPEPSAPEPEPEAEPSEPETAPEEVREEPPSFGADYFDTSDMLTNLFYGLAILALVVLGAYWHYARKKD